MVPSVVVSGAGCGAAHTVRRSQARGHRIYGFSRNVPGCGLGSPFLMMTSRMGMPSAPSSLQCVMYEVTRVGSTGYRSLGVVEAYNQCCARIGS